MSYSTVKLTTVAQCDDVLAMAANKKSDFLYEQTGISRSSTGIERSNAKLSADLASVTAQLSGYTAALDVLTDEKSRANMQSKIRKLNDRKENLEERVGKSGTSSILENELDLMLLDKQIAEIELFMTAVTDRKSGL